MNANDEMWDAVKILMKESFWGKTSSIDSLIRNLKAEVEEFIIACNLNDIENSKEEAADVVMVIFCILYKIAEERLLSPDDIANYITKKLHWRYNHLYNYTELFNSDIEFEKWEDAKKIECSIELMFCENINCSNYCKIDHGNVQFFNGKFWCSKCGSEIIPSKNNTLLFNDKNASIHIKQICESIVSYARGKRHAIESLYIDYPTAYKTLYNILNDAHSKEGKKNVLTTFEDFVQRKYNISQTIIQEYLYHVMEMKRKMKLNGLLEKYYEQIQNCDYKAKNKLTFAEWSKVKKELQKLNFDVVKTIEKSVHFNSRSWDNQIAYKYLIKYPDKKSESVIECTTLIHYIGADVRDLTIEISNMYNCIVGCRFCASGALPLKVQYLESLDYIRQLNTCLMQSGINPNDFEKFYISFAGIGEPSAVYKEIASGMVIIYDVYPNVWFNIATFGYKKECFEYWSNLNLPIRTLQIPIYHFEKAKLQNIVDGIPLDYNLLDVVACALMYKKNNPICQVKINFIPMRGINDSDEDIKSIIHMLEPFKNDISVKISFLNYTKPAEENGYVTPGYERLKEIKSIFENYGFDVYVFGTVQNTSLGCGQLAQNYISG